MPNKLVYGAVLLALGAVDNATAGSFANGGFESGDFSGWTQGSGYWNGGWPMNPANYQTGAANYDASAQASAVVGAGLDPVLVEQGVNIQQVYSGNYSARINDGNANYSVNTIQQTVLNYTDPKIYFAWSAVLIGSHGATDSDNFTLTLHDNTSNTDLYNVTYSSANAPASFKEINGIYYSDWQVQILDVSTLSGHSFTLS